MPLIKRRTDIAANAQAFPLQGSQYEFLPFDALVEFALLADTGDNIDASAFSGSDVLLENSRIDELALATPITYPDDYSLTDVAAAGERIGVAYREAGAIAVTVRTSVKITAL